MTRAGIVISVCWILGGTLVGVEGVEQAPPGYLEQLAAAEAKWAANKPAAYEFRVQPACNGLIAPNPPEYQPPLMRVSGVRNTVEIDSTSWTAKYATIEKQFAFIRTAWTSKPLRVEVEYDQKLGHPIRVCVDPSNVSDDEFGFLVTDFRAVPDGRQSQ